MGLEECLSILRSSNKFSQTLIDELDSNVGFVLMQQGFLASALQSHEDLLAKEKGIRRVQDDIQYCISQRAKLRGKLSSLLEERTQLEAQLREVNEKLETTQVLLAQTDSKIEEYSPMLQEATISSTSLARHESNFSIIVVNSNAVLTRFRYLIVNNF